MTTRRRLTTWAAACTAGLTTLAVAVAATAAPGDAAPAGRAAPVTGNGGYLAPYWTEADLTGDDAVTTADLDRVVAALGRTRSDTGWAAVAAADHDGDGRITVGDVADLSQRIVYDDGPFTLLEASALDMQEAMNAGTVTSVQLTRDYLARIAAYDELVDSTHSRALNAVITTAGDAALAAAAESDRLRALNGGPRSMVDGVPVVVKDNYDTRDMPTTGGCGCWDANQTTDDATMVAGLRGAGAVVLAKASLDEFAFGFVSEFSSYLPSGTSALVASPNDLARTAGGSSGGTGAAISANLGGIGFGTDTGGSIRVPSSYNQLVGVRPTVGLASRSGIVPLALSQDTGGPITRSVSDAAIALDEVVATDGADPAQADAARTVPTSYTSFLDPTALAGTKIGYLQSMVGTNATTLRLFNQAVADLTAQGATVTPITIDNISATLNEPSGSTNEFKHDLDAYVAAHLDPDVTARSLQGILDSGRFVPSRRSTYTSRNQITQQQYDTWIASHGTVLRTGRANVTAALDAGDLDALIYPTGTPYGTQGTNLRLSPNTGLPAVTVPMGQATAADGTITGAGVNLEILGRAYDEGSLLGLAYDYEQATEHRVAPALYPALGATPATPATPAPRAPSGLSVTTTPSEVTVGDTVTMTVSAADSADLYAHQLDVTFDPAALSYVDGSTSADAGGATYGVASPGRVRVVHTELGASPATTGPVTLARLQFTATRSGPASLVAGPLVSVSTATAETTTAAVGTSRVAVRQLPAAAVTSAPVVSGTPRLGATLRATAGTFAVPGLTATYQWLRDGEPMPGAVRPTYELALDDVGRRLSVVVTATGADRVAATATSAATGPVTRAPAAVTVRVPRGARAGRALPVRVVVRGAELRPTGTLQVRYDGRLVASELVRGRRVVVLPARPSGTHRLVVRFRPETGFTGDRVVTRVGLR